MYFGFRSFSDKKTLVHNYIWIYIYNTYTPWLWLTVRHGSLPWPESKSMGHTVLQKICMGFFSMANIHGMDSNPKISQKKVGRAVRSPAVPASNQVLHHLLGGTARWVYDSDVSDDIKTCYVSYSIVLYIYMIRYMR